MRHFSGVAGRARLKVQVTLRAVSRIAAVGFLAALCGCGGGQTKPPVNNPLPAVTQLSPAFVVAGSAPQPLTITGTDFVSSSTVNFNGVKHNPPSVTSSQLAISLSAADQANVGCYSVDVTNPAPGGGVSNAANFVVSNDNPVYVLDTDNHRVQLFDSNGNYVSQFSHSFDLPTGIALDCSHNVFVRDGNTHCSVDKFDGNGNFLLQFGQCATPAGGTGPGIFDNAGSVATDAAGNVWVTSPDFYTMQKFDSTGNFQSIICMSNNVVSNCPMATPVSVQPQGVAIDVAGNIYVANVDPFTGPNIVKFDGSGKYLATIGAAGTGNGQFSNTDGFGIAFDSSGNVYVTDSGNNRVQKFTGQGNYLGQFGSSGSGNGQFNQPVGIGFDGSGNLYITDVANNRVQKFDANGNYLSQFGTFGSGNGQFFAPLEVTIMP